MDASETLIDALLERSIVDAATAIFATGSVDSDANDALEALTEH